MSMWRCIAGQLLHWQKDGCGWFHYPFHCSLPVCQRRFAPWFTATSFLPTWCCWSLHLRPIIKVWNARVSNSTQLDVVCLAIKYQSEVCNALCTRVQITFPFLSSHWLLQTSNWTSLSLARLEFFFFGASSNLILIRKKRKKHDVVCTFWVPFWTETTRGNAGTEEWTEFAEN